jgi:hypothetical protein
VNQYNEGKCRVGTATGMPAEVRIMASSVGENSKLEVAFAEANFASTKIGRDSDRPRRIFHKAGRRNGQGGEVQQASYLLRKESAHRQTLN